MSEDRRLYPLTTPQGEPIPLDVVRVHGLGRIDVTNTDKEIALATEIEILVLYATEMCIVRLGVSAASVPASLAYLADAVLVPADQFMVIDKNEATELHAIRFDTDGVLWINGIRAWQDTKKAAQFNRA
jgi:hypothetical protein